MSFLTIRGHALGNPRLYWHTGSGEAGTPLKLVENHTELAKSG